MQVVESSGGYLPTSGQLLFLKACCLEPEDALAAWEQWRACFSLDTVDDALYRLLPLLYRNLQHAGYEGPEMPLLKGVYRRNWYGNQKLFHATAQALQLLHAADIPALLLKGIALSHAYYPDPHMRSMSDGDIMVPLDRAEAAMESLKRAGWHVRFPLKHDYKHTSHACLFANGSGQDLDLHWHLFSECCGDGDDTAFWEHAVPLPFQSQPALTLSPADHLLHTCIHGYQWNALHSLRWIADAHWILKVAGDRIDWRDMIAQARRLRLTLRLRNALDFLQGQCAAPVPEEILRALHDVPVSTVERREYAVLIQSDHRDEKTAFLWPFRRVWYRQQRFYPERSFAMRVLTLPAMVSNELYLSSTWKLPAALTRLMFMKLTYRFLSTPGGAA